MKRIEISHEEARSLVGKMLEQVRKDHEADKPPIIGVLELAVSFAPDHNAVAYAIRIRAKEGVGYVALIPEEHDCVHCADQVQIGDMLAER